jgi:predicted metal-dependent hydrolase
MPSFAASLMLVAPNDNESASRDLLEFVASSQSAIMSPRESTDIPRRQVELAIERDAVSGLWMRGDVYMTTLLEALSLVFPEGERFFVDSVRQLRDRVTTPELAASVAAFIGQEAMHAKEHRALNQTFEAAGLGVASSIDTQLRGILQLVRRVLAPESNLAATAALEHFTAILAEGLLTNQRWRDDFTREVRPLWLWHALEEIEHKAVAMDVYRAAGGGEVRRLAIMVAASILFFTILGYFQLRIVRTRGGLRRPWRLIPGFARIWIWPAYFTRLAPAYLSYYRPGFHPHDRETRALIAVWRERLFGPSGELSLRLGGREAA